MDRLRQTLGRMKGIGRGSRISTGGKGVSSRRLGLVIVLGVVGCMVVSILGSAARPGTMGITGAPATLPAISGYLGERDAGKLQYNAITGQPPMEQEASAPATGGGDNLAPQTAAQEWDRKIIRTATLQIRVKDVAASVDQVRSIAGAHMGYVSASDSHQEGEYMVATVTLQVPSPEFDDAVSKLRGIGVKVVQENVSSSDVTEEFVDLESQLRNLKATEARMLALLARAEKIEDILTLDRELRQIQAEIERAQGRLNFLSKRSEMSTITLTLYPDALPVEPVVQQVEGWDPWQVIVRAWEASLDLLAGIATVVLTAAVFMWWTLPLLLLGMWLLLRPRRREVAPVGPAAPAGEAS